jgi:hypothetical protein
MRLQRTPLITAKTAAARAIKLGAITAAPDAIASTLTKLERPSKTPIMTSTLIGVSG